MSGFVVMVPLVAGWPVFVAAAAAAGAVMGLKAMEKGSLREDNSVSEVEIGLPANYSLSSAIDEGESMQLEGNGFSVIFEKTGRGDCIMRVYGQNKTKGQLETLGKELINGIAQQYAYQKLTAELKKKGFQVSKEEVSADKTIHLTVNRWK
ncbi:MAG: DUF1257 domain-containing protein [Candidatus Riflebacteria bacterium]|nr:DUF1257 domain-containing protein [Candidatus Riflebacteria bacterium]